MPNYIKAGLNDVEKLKAQNAELLRALERLTVGVTKESTEFCEWYEGIEFDAIDEAHAIINKEN